MLCRSAFYDDVIVFDSKTRKLSQPVTTFPQSMPARAMHSATLVGNRTIWFIGGGDMGSIFEDVHTLDVFTWEWRVVEVKCVGGEPLPNSSCLPVTVQTVAGLCDCQRRTVPGCHMCGGTLGRCATPAVAPPWPASSRLSTVARLHAAAAAAAVFPVGFSVLPAPAVTPTACWRAQVMQQRCTPTTPQ